MIQFCYRGKKILYEKDKMIVMVGSPISSVAKKT